MDPQTGQPNVARFAAIPQEETMPFKQRGKKAGKSKRPRKSAAGKKRRPKEQVILVRLEPHLI
jgi:hypothetical protein